MEKIEEKYKKLASRYVADSVKSRADDKRHDRVTKGEARLMYPAQKDGL